ncbi:unnamed protein product [Polarella glacialis]|uniref:Uncharacterized protein n=1 Tax=Polarella glacialis TaxID=89957 RepID=A0A813JE69_POLGL|nr:unnamed protein product [Polarella glacialis]CAE8676572.1 unnamed protein product [Polarella glacialis]
MFHNVCHKCECCTCAREPCWPFLICACHIGDARIDTECMGGWCLLTLVLSFIHSLLLKLKCTKFGVGKAFAMNVGPKDLSCKALLELRLMLDPECFARLLGWGWGWGWGCSSLLSRESTTSTYQPKSLLNVSRNA